MEQNELRPVDMTGVFGSRAVASQALSGKRGSARARQAVGGSPIYVEA